MTDERPLLVVRLKVDPKKEAEFNSFYHDWYLPRFMKFIPEFVSVHRYVSDEENGQRTYLTVYEFKDEASVAKAMAAIDDPARDEERQRWHEYEDHYIPEITATVFHQIYPR